jgi:hypothetical protein
MAAILENGDHIGVFRDIQKSRLAYLGFILRELSSKKDLNRLCLVVWPVLILADGGHLGK